MFAAAAVAAPRGQIVTAGSALTENTKTVCGSFASSALANVLAVDAGQILGSTLESLLGFYFGWIICDSEVLFAVILLFFLPKLALTGIPVITERPSTAVQGTSSAIGGSVPHL